MHYSISHISASRLALATIVVAGMLLVLAARANAESTDATAVALGSVGESPASIETAPPPAATAEPTAAPEPAAAPEPVGVTEAAGTDDSGNGLAERASPTVRTPVQVEPDAVTPPAPRVPEPTGQIHPDTQGATALVTSSTKTVARAANPATPIDQANSLGHHALQAAGETLHRGPLHQVIADTVENSQPPAGAPSGVDVGTFSHHAAPKPPRTLPTGGDPRVQVTILNSFLPWYPAQLGGIEPLQLELPNVGGNLAAHALSQIPAEAAGKAFLGDAGERADNLASLPLNGNLPTPSPDLPQVAGSGSDGSPPFSSIVALLALLALVASAILRRLREVPDFAAPTPFVCALERPG